MPASRLKCYSVVTFARDWNTGTRRFVELEKRTAAVRTHFLARFAGARWFGTIAWYYGSLCMVSPIAAAVRACLTIPVSA